jgi:predicted ATPase
LILGEPGIGVAARRAIEEHVAEASHLRLRFVCQPQFTQAARCAPVINRIERLAGFSQSDTLPIKVAREARSHLEPAVVADGGGRGLVAELLSLPATHGSPPGMTPQQRRELTLARGSQLLQSSARASPLMVVWDDVHWIDATSQSLLDDLAAIANLPILLVITSRPIRPAWHEQAQVTTRCSNAWAAGYRGCGQPRRRRAAARADGADHRPHRRRALFVEELTKTS